MKAHCLFEQSGTFKNEFKKLGIEAFDYDILNDYGQTDFQIDLFAEIEKAYRGDWSIFDDMSSDDLVLAFFPCTRFECQCQLLFTGNAYQFTNVSDEYKLEYDIKLHEELHELYTLLCKMCLVVIRKGLRMVIENPVTQPHYLTYYWSIKPAIIDKDRSLNGDYMKKPTQFFFINCDPKNNIIFEPIEHVDRRCVERLVNGEKDRKTLRSEIHPQYASRFIRQYLIDYEQDISKLFETEE